MNRRIVSDIMDLMMNHEKSLFFPIKFLSDNPLENIYQLRISMMGPDNTPYENLWFDMEIKFPLDYPYSGGPSVTFLTYILHYNVYNTGLVCLDVLKEKWNSSYDLTTVLKYIYCLLQEPNPNSPANVEISGMSSEEIRDKIKRRNCGL